MTSIIFASTLRIHRGHEMRAVAFYPNIVDREGIEAE
jgi:hypothetical protein